VNCCAGQDVDEKDRRKKEQEEEEEKGLMKMREVGME
jgi:hypothetical protein